MPTILRGTTARDALVQKLTEKTSHLPTQPKLVILQVGARPDSDAYIRQKKLLAEKIGVRVIHMQYEPSISQTELIEQIKKYNADDSVHGIILQIPLPAHLDKTTLLETIAPDKDVDGLTSHTKFVPATAKGVLSLLKFYSIDVKGKKVTVIGKSALVGGPIARILREQGAIVTTCDKKTGDLIPYTKPADIIIVAAGSPKLIKAEHVSPGQTIIDVGINELMHNGKRTLVGDVDHEGVEPIVAAISPVPGGVGPMTVVSLLENVVESATQKMVE